YKDRISIEYVPYPETNKILGRTYDIAVIDLMNDLKPNDLGRLVGLVRGGGFLIIFLPAFNEFYKMITRFQQNLVTIGYTSSDVRHIFKKRFVRKIFEHPGIIVYDTKRKIFLKEEEVKEVPRYVRRKPVIPPKTKFPKRVYELALTQDQVEVLSILENLYQKLEEDEKVAVVITADRGRGKSCAVGIGIAALAHKLRRAKGRCDVIVTAPSITNVISFFELSEKTLRKLGYEIEVERNSEGFVTALRGKGIYIFYREPLQALGSRGDIIAVDEAAGLQVPMLFGIHKRFKKMIFSSTIHGYEGAGRGFSVRFLTLLRKDPKTRVYEYEMEEPIRYAPEDPIEKWLFDTLLLDAEPAELNEQDLKLVEQLAVEYYVPDLEEFFLKKEDELREFVGIYVIAHYRNNPDDIGMMMDAPHHEIRALRLSTGKIVTSVELAKEGNIPEKIIWELVNGAWVAGNIIPDRLVKHYRIIDFPKLVGWRIVRIATHPEVQKKGLGSKALQEIENEAKERGYDWVGAGFGVNYELLNFWVKNGYIPVHISPDRNPVSGEYTVIVVKPLSTTASKLISYANREFRVKLLHSLHEPYYDLNPRVARLLLRNWGIPLPLKLNLTESQKGRLMSYAWELMTLENCFDAVQNIVRIYFADHSRDKPTLTPLEEIILIVKVLQAKSWRKSCEQLKMTPPDLMAKVREIIRKLCIYYLGASEDKVRKFSVKV
ncbi:MAG TPA: tRNA(Met) cytidine acetyltransferase, partial [Thermoproteales archaeon]|nr:tRNA(Met) cytidine acetyltransferase [Thermoproteales archaeon]